MIDFSALLYDPVYAKIGMPAVLTAAGTAGEVALTVIDDTRPKVQPAGSAEVRSVGPGAFVRIPELAAAGIARADYLDAVLTFNGRTWQVRSYELRGSPNGEDLGEVRLLLEGNGGAVIDVREGILARLVEVVAAIPNLRSAQRNNVDIPEDQLPAAIIFDGDEETSDANDVSAHPSHKSILVQMTPEIVIAQQTDEVGSDLTTLRRELIKRVLTDAELNEQIVKTGRHGNGAIRYLGCQTDLGWMRSMHGALRAQFLFQYALKPWEL